jgi:hypothetical protein|tara:strand:+ start:11358 stop:12776 length:1419 start_codon:yes stop_codon:yes gene_type:complete
MYLSQFFTEYDDTLSQNLNIDPLGMTMIWSALGQRIFKNRVSSISNDVRNYTLNLVHHLAIKELVDSSIRLAGQVSNLYPNIDSLSFKQACLIHAENLFVYSMLEGSNQADKQVGTLGILGASKGRKKQNSDGKFNATLTFTHTAKSNLLVRQLTLGVSGRYKTPFIEMQFFDKEYRYKHPNFEPSWRLASELVNSRPALKQVKEHLKQHFKVLLSTDSKEPQCCFSDVMPALKEAYTLAFATPEVVGSLTKEFWLSVTGLNQGAAGTLYDVIEAHKQESGQPLKPEQLFNIALSKCEDKEEEHKLQQIIDVEPFLAECEMLFRLVMSERIQSSEDLYDKYLELGRTSDTLPNLASSLVDKIAIQQVLTGIANGRYKKLLKLAQLPSEDDQQGFIKVVQHLLRYHAEIMIRRGQSAWVEQDNKGNFRCHIKLAKEPNKSNSPINTWYHRYYISEFHQLISGLEGQAQTVQQT